MRDASGSVCSGRLARSAFWAGFSRYAAIACLAVCLALGLGVTSAHAAVTVVSTESGDQTAPRISGNQVVYTNNPSGHLAYPDTDDREVWLFDLGTRVSRRIATGVHSLAADISPSTVVYVRDIGGVHWLASYDIAASKETTLVVVPKGFITCSNDPRISGNRVVWQQRDLGGSGVELFDLGTRMKTEVATPTAGAPAVSGGVVVWEDWRDHESDIFMHDLTTMETLRLTDAPQHRLAPTVSGNRVLWQVSDAVWDPQAVSSFDRVAAAQSVLDAQNAHSPSVSGNVAVWARVRNPGNPADVGSDLYRYDFSQQAIRRLTGSSAEKVPGGVDADRYVWAQQDVDGTGWNIYALLSLPSVTSIGVITERTPETDASFELTGTLNGAGSGLTVICERTGVGPGLWSTVGTCTTGAGGQFQFTSKAVARASYRFRFEGSSTLGPSESADISVWPTATIRRLSGLDRYETAIAVSKAAYPATADCVVIATGSNYPDALAASTLAHAYHGPILLSTPTSVPAKILTEIKRLGPKRVFVVGSEAALSKAVYNQLSALPTRPTMKRLGGANRFETSAAIARQVAVAVGPISKVVVVTGMDFGDALAAAPVAAAHGWPILLTSPTALPVSVSAVVRDLKPTTSLVVGTTSAVSDGVKNVLPLPERVSGATRAAATVAVAQWARTKNLEIGHIVLATDANFPDALAAGPLLALDGGILLLTPTNSASMPAASATFVSQNRDTILRVELLGGSNVVSDGYIAKMRGLLAR